jgi:hypothetical protein
MRLPQPGEPGPCIYIPQEEDGPVIPPDFFQIVYKISVRTSQETHYISITKSNRLLLFRETIAVYCDNDTEHTDTFRGQNEEF